MNEQLELNCQVPDSDIEAILRYEGILNPLPPFRGRRVEYSGVRGYSMVKPPPRSGYVTFAQKMAAKLF